ncbi:MAG: hypothetical protein NTV79_00480, partial [Candidatus Aureabacteria bacterium]|nr:hypothetical protein [Candidatus Auribacterota bacterium]
MRKLLLFLSVFFLPVAAPTAGQGPGLLTVVFLNVGQGDSTRIHTPGGTHLLIDGGPAGQNRGTDAGRRVILPVRRS